MVTEELKNLIVDSYQKGCSLREVGKMVGKNCVWVRRFLMGLGIQTRKVKGLRKGDLDGLNRDQRYYLKVKNDPVLHEKAKKRRYLSHIKKTYGLSEERYLLMLEKQGMRCVICGFAFKEENWGMGHVDHCHKTGRVRGILCRLCNLLLGAARDDQVILRKAVNYLERTKLP
jgi:Recombination endonuclease VII